MPRLTIVSPSSTAVTDATPGATILAALQRAGWHLPAPCGGAGVCGKCRVVVSPHELAGPPDEQERKLLGDEPGTRLACRCVPEGDITVTLPGEAVPPATAGSDAKGGDVSVAAVKRSVIDRHVISLGKPSLDDQRSLAQRLRDALDSHVAVSPSTLMPLVPYLDGREFLAVVNSALSPSRVVLTSQNTSTKSYGLGFDIGTTTVAGYLLESTSGKVVTATSEPNAQGSFGADVISRITAFNKGAPLDKAIRTQLKRMASSMCAVSGVETSQLVDACIVGNTTMLHLVLGIDPSSMSRTPFTPILTEAVTVEPTDVGLDLAPGALLYLPPGVSAYVGADIVADLISTGMHDRAGFSLLIDIGTNGEIVLGGRDGLFACSTAAGPAFEGASIRHGSGGVAGAVSHVRRDGETLAIEVIAGEEPSSICGTGLLDLVSMLLNDGCIDETGRMAMEGVREEIKAWYAPRVIEDRGEPAFVFAERSDGSRLILTQADVRQLQLAKGAIAAGVRFLLERAGIRAEQLEAVYLAGGFGTYVRPEAAVRIGIIPGVSPEQIIAVGNAAGAGAVRLLLDAESRTAAESLAQSVAYEELSGKPRFQELYMEEMLFPE
ncbi:MAG: ASKHA domain-containing protein [Spirochaetota bacterium]